MYLKVCECWTYRKPLIEGGGGLFYAERWIYDPQEWCTNSIEPSTRLKSSVEMENLVLNIFCSMILFNKNDKLRRYKQTTDFGDLYISPPPFSNSSNLRGKISNIFFHCRTQCFFSGGGWRVKRSPMDTKFHCQTSAMLNRSQLRFKNAIKSLDRYPAYDKSY